MKLIIDIPDKEYKTLSKMSEKEKVNELSYYERVIANGIPYESKCDLISREVINSEIEKRYCNKHCVVPSEEPYCPDSCPARFFKNIVKDCPTMQL